MKEYRVYMVDLYFMDESLEDVENWNDERFIQEAENQGLVYSLKGFEDQWRKGNIGYCDFSCLRILEVEAN
jgi:hypothetical protein